MSMRQELNFDLNKNILVNWGNKEIGQCLNSEILTEAPKCAPPGSMYMPGPMGIRLHFNFRTEQDTQK